jgi:hypothetical protein
MQNRLAAFYTASEFAVQEFQAQEQRVPAKSLTIRFAAQIYTRNGLL